MSPSAVALAGWKGKKRSREAESSETEFDDKETTREENAEVETEGQSETRVDGPCVELWANEKRDLAQREKPTKGKLGLAMIVEMEMKRQHRVEMETRESGRLKGVEIAEVQRMILLRE